MSLTIVKGMQSEIFVPITPPMVWTPVTKELKDMKIALATAAGVHHKEQKRFNLAGDFTWREVKNEWKSGDLMVSHGGYDNGDVNKDIIPIMPILSLSYPYSFERKRAYLIALFASITGTGCL